MNKTVSPFDTKAHPDSVVNLMIFIELCLAIGIAMRALLRRLGCYEIYRVFLYLSGVLIGLFLSKTVLVNIHVMQEYHKVVGVNIYVPFLIFTQAYLVDVQLFTRSFGKVCLASGTFWLLLLTLGATIMLSVTRGEFGFKYLQLACIFCYLFPLEMTTDLNKREIFINIFTFLEGETLVRIFLTTVIDEFLGPSEITVWYWRIIRFLLGVVLGFIVGLMLGKFHDAICILMSYDVINLICYFIFVIFGSVLVARLLQLNLIVFMTTIAIILGANRKCFSLDIDTQILFTINYIFLLLETTITISTALILFTVGRKFISILNVALGVLCFVTFVILRLCVFSLYRSIFTKFTFGFSWLGFLILTFAGMKGNCTLIYLRRNFDLPNNDLMFWNVYIIIFVADFLMTIVSSISMRLILFKSRKPLTPQQVNLNQCLRYLMVERKHFLNFHKQDKLLGGGDYDLAMKVTEIPLFFPSKSQSDYEDAAPEKHFSVGTQRVRCDKCEGEELGAPTKTELVEMIRCAEADLKKAKRMYYESQYNKGMISKENMERLRQIFQNSSDEDVMMNIAFNPSLQNKGFYNWLRKKIVAASIDETLKLHRNDKFSYFLYQIVYHRHAKTLKAFISLFYALLSIVLTYYYGVLYQRIPQYVHIFIPILCSYLMVEFCIKCLIYLLVCGNLKNAFSRFWAVKWNWVDFFFFCLTLANMSIYFTAHRIDAHPSLNVFFFVLDFLNTFRLIMLIRWFNTHEHLVERFVCFCDINCNINLFRVYDLALCYLECENQILMRLNTMIDHIDAAEPIARNLGEIRLRLASQLARMEFENPTVVRLIKTEIVARVTRKFLYDSMRALRMNGQIDRDIGKIIMLDLSLRFNLENWMQWDAYKMGPTNILQSIPWLDFEIQSVVEYLQLNLQKRMFKENDFILKETMYSDGIFIILSGIVRSEVVATPEFVRGLLPTIDYIQSTTNVAGHQDFHIAGNSLGELCLLNARPYNSRLIAATDLTCYFITNSVIENAFRLSNDLICGLEARMWRSVTYNLVVYILLQTTKYQNWSIESIYNVLNNAFVPTLNRFQKLAVTNCIRDVVLLQGIVQEEDTANVFYGPCYIPRTVRGIVKCKSNFNLDGYETKLLIIPTIELDYIKLIEVEPQSFEMISCYKETCLQHVIQKYPRKSYDYMETYSENGRNNDEEDEWSSDDYENLRLQVELNELVTAADKKLEPMSTILPQMQQLLMEKKDKKHSSLDSEKDSEEDSRRVKFRKRRKKKFNDSS